MTQLMEKPASESRVATMFDKIAPRYDFLNQLLSLRQDKVWRRYMIAQIPYTNKGKLLDVATGTGDVLFEMITQHPEYESYTGVDISKGMLNLAKAKCQSLSTVPSIHLEVMSATKLNFESSQFNCLTIAFGLRNVVDRLKALREFNRVLKTGGTLLIMDFFNPDNTLISRAFQFYFHKILPKIGATFSDKEAYNYLPKSVSSFYESKELYQVLEANGFSVTKNRKFLFGSCQLFVATKIN